MNGEREKFGSSELAICLSHYHLGIIKSIREFPRGSRKAPKAVIDCQQGRFLFKRRVRGKEDIKKVAFTHQIQLFLAAQSFPLPHLIGTLDDNNSFLMLDDRIYELFEYIEGVNYDGTLDATFHAGRILGLYHKLLGDFCSDFVPPRGSYHDAKGVKEAILNTVRALPAPGRPAPDVLMEVVTYLEQAYRQCAESAGKEGINDWPAQIVHGDWHPGNMLFRESNVVAVIDYDSARVQQRVIDLANGALQFSILGGSEDASKWPDYPDETRLKRFVRGYDAANVVSTAELNVVPFLMCEAMIAEAVLPIAATGSFGRMEGFPFLQMIQRKVKWVLDNVPHLQTMLRD